MDHKNARDLANEWGSIEERTPTGKLRDDEYNGRHAAPMVWAVAQQLITTIPDAAVAAALKRLPLDSDGEPRAVISAIDGRALYFIDCVALSPAEDASSPTATAQTRCIPLDPTAGSMSLATTITQPFGQLRHQNPWTFEIGGESLSFQSEYVVGHNGDEQDRFARALAKALGYQMPEASGEQQLAA